MQYDYESLAVLAAVVREGSFDTAAKALSVTQSAVSQRIKSLEDKVGGLLVVRGRPCVPTKLGLQLSRHFEEISLLQFELSQQIGHLVEGDESGHVAIRVGVNNDSLSTWFPAALLRASKELNVVFDIVPDDQEHTEASLVSGDVMAIITSNEKALPGCQRLSLGSMDYIAVASKGFYDGNFPDGVSLETLTGTICIAFDRKDTIQNQWMSLAFGGVAKVNCHFVPSYDGYIACCLNGAGWGLVPSFDAWQHIESGDLVELSPGKAVTVPLSWQSATLSSDMMRRLGAIVMEEAKKGLKVGKVTQFAEHKKYG